MFYREAMVPQEFARQTFSAEDALEYISELSQPRFDVSEIVLFRRSDGNFSFARVKQREDSFYYVELLNTQEYSMASRDMLFPLAFFWKVIFQPSVSLLFFNDLITTYISTEPLHLKPYIKAIGAKSGSHYLTISDIHGDIHALQQIMRDWYQRGFIDKNLSLKCGYNVIALGDYKDRGEYGVEVLFVLLLLYLRNPSSVYLLAGNHESSAMLSEGAFIEEWHRKFGTDRIAVQSFDLVKFLFDQLPTGLLVGLTQSDTLRVEPYLMFCHGGICSILDIRTMLSNHALSGPSVVDHEIEDVHDYAMRWTDFYTAARDESIMEAATSRPAIFRGTGLPELTQEFFKEYVRHFGTCLGESGSVRAKLLALIRGHQHTRGGVVLLNKHLAREAEGLEHYLTPEETQQAYSWQVLANREKHCVESADVYTVTSAGSVLWGQGRHAHSYALVHASKTGEWKLTPFSV